MVIIMSSPTDSVGRGIMFLAVRPPCLFVCPLFSSSGQILLSWYL